MRLAEVALHLPPEDVEEVGRSRGGHNGKVGILNALNEELVFEFESL